MYFFDDYEIKRRETTYKLYFFIIPEATDKIINVNAYGI